MSHDIPLEQFSGPGPAAQPGELLPMPAPPDREAILAGGQPGVLARYRAGIGVFSPDLLSLSDEDLDTAFRPDAGVGRWSIRMVLGHLADAEVYNFMRFRKTVAEDGPLLPAWDYDAYFDAGLYDGPATDTGSVAKIAGRSGQPPAAYLALMHAIRTATSEWLALLPPAAWDRQALHPTRGPMTLLNQVGSCAWHLEHHAWFIEAKARKLAGRSVLSTLGGV